jgi:hypothetical protein
MKAKQSPMIVNTAKTDGIITPIKYARTKNGKIDLDAYKGKKGQIKENNLTIDVNIVDSRVRYGHLDLRVTPVSGDGEVWVERKNILIHNDPAMTVKENKVAARTFVSDHDNNGAKAFSAMNADELRALVTALVEKERKTQKA